jgi:hypothetical protein
MARNKYWIPYRPKWLESFRSKAAALGLRAAMASTKLKQAAASFAAIGYLAFPSDLGKGGTVLMSAVRT